ncbi:hypothetical protein EHQ47_18470 [Leptospira bourretii]|uniref:VapE domain-containing protein n=1 Tax=Leptospira bourretii TaxID=2484962 RepID=UPI001090F3AA|nr:VapE domain-containing protein [Leptospira bourretii]TGL18021.1 hypothetical protein EHQ47_18470 [Leptospira bourretii]
MFNQISKETIEQFFGSPLAFWREDEYFTLNPLRADRNVGSFHINVNGKWFDHATKEGGGIIELLSKSEKISEKEAYHKLFGENYLNKRLSNPKIFDKWYDTNYQLLNLRLVKSYDHFGNRIFYWQNSLDGVDWKRGKKNKKTLLYNLLNVRNAKIVFFVEGEGCVESIQQVLENPDYSATTTGSASSWTPKIKVECVSLLQGKIVYIMPDNDDEGRAYAQQVYDSLSSNNIEVYILDLPGLKDIQIKKDNSLVFEKQDVADWLNAGNKINTILELCEQVRKSNTKPSSNNLPLDWKTIKDLVRNCDTFAAIDIVLRNRYEKRFNKVTYQADIRLIGSNEWLTVDDRLFQTLWKDINTGLDGSGKRISSELLHAALNSISGDDYDPFIEWAERIQLRNFEEEGDSELAKLFSYLKTESEREDDFFKLAMTRWLIGFYRLMLNQVEKNEICPVISGRQGIGKNRLIDKLFESIDRKYIFTGSIQADNKDSRKRIATMALINLDEFDATTRKSDISALKSLITSTEFIDRLPYGRTDTFLKRRTSFIASINAEESILNDDTGTRRFPTFRLTEINLDKVLELDTLKIWGEIKYLFEKKKVDSFFTDSELSALEKRNEKFVKKEAFEDYIKEKYSPNPIDNFSKRRELTSAQVIDEVTSEAVKKNLTVDKAGKILKKAGFTQIKRRCRYFILFEKIETPMNLVNGTIFVSNDLILTD